MEWICYVQERYHHPESKWIKEIIFYRHRLDEDAHQFKDFKFRKALIELGEYNGEIPIQYPMTLTNGIVINEGDYWREPKKEYPEEE